MCLCMQQYFINHSSEIVNFRFIHLFELSHTTFCICADNLSIHPICFRFCQNFTCKETSSKASWHFSWTILLFSQQVNVTQSSTTKTFLTNDIMKVLCVVSRIFALGKTILAELIMLKEAPLFNSIPKIP